MSDNVSLSYIPPLFKLMILSFILPLIFDMAWSFKFFTLCFAKAVTWDSHEMRKNFLACQILQRKCNGNSSSSTWMLLFWHRGTRTGGNDLEWETYLYDICSLVASLIIMLTFHCTLYLIHNKLLRRLEKIRGNIKCFSKLSWPWHNL